MQDEVVQLLGLFPNVIRRLIADYTWPASQHGATFSMSLEHEIKELFALKSNRILVIFKHMVLLISIVGEKLGQLAIDEPEFETYLSPDTANLTLVSKHSFYTYRIHMDQIERKAIFPRFLAAENVETRFYMTNSSLIEWKLDEIHTLDLNNGERKMVLLPSELRLIERSHRAFHRDKLYIWTSNTLFIVDAEGQISKKIPTGVNITNLWVHDDGLLILEETPLECFTFRRNCVHRLVLYDFQTEEILPHQMQRNHILMKAWALSTGSPLLIATQYNDYKCPSVTQYDRLDVRADPSQRCQNLWSPAYEDYANQCDWHYEGQFPNGDMVFRRMCVGKCRHENHIKEKDVGVYVYLMKRAITKRIRLGNFEDATRKVRFYRFSYFLCVVHGKTITLLE
jgi:hypothetical protein